MYDIIVVGSGSAGQSAGKRAASKKIHTLILTKDQVIPSLQNVVENSEKYLECKDSTEVVRVEKNIVSFLVEDKTGKQYYARALIFASGQDESGQANSGFETFTEKTATGHIKVDGNMQASTLGIWAAGFVNDTTGKDAEIASAQGLQAAENAFEYLQNLK